MTIKVWEQAEIALETPGSAVRHVSAVTRVTDCATRPSVFVVLGVQPSLPIILLMKR